MAGKETLRLYVDPRAVGAPDAQKTLAQAASILREGGTVAFPTETVYGLGANALDAKAIAGIFHAKQRPSWDPLIVHIAHNEQLANVASSVPPAARALIEAFWPGPLTLLLPKAPSIPDAVTAGRARVGVRAPAHPVARELIRLAGVPVAAPSANSFGRTSPTRAEYVLEDLEGRIDAVIDSGEATLGLESTVVDICEDPPILYRPGMITLQELRNLCPSLIAYQEKDHSGLEPAALPSPGVGMKHYAPRARLVLASEPTRMLEAAEPYRSAGERVGLMLPDGQAPESGYLVYAWGDWSDKQTLAKRLFAGLRELDAKGATVIVCPLPTEQGLGSAMRDRLQKAARETS